MKLKLRYRILTGMIAYCELVPVNPSMCWALARYIKVGEEKMSNAS